MAGDPNSDVAHAARPEYPGETSPLRKFTWVDLPFIVIPGVLLVSLALSWQGHEAARSMAVWSLYTFSIFVGFYVATRLLVPRRARVMVVTIVIVPAVLSFLAGGISLAAGFAIWAFFSAPLFGILFGAAFIPKRRHWPASVAVSA